MPYYPNFLPRENYRASPMRRTQLTQNSVNQRTTRTITMKFGTTACRRVFYRIVLPTSDASATESQRLLKTWCQDFGVTLFRLPWETCIGLASCLQQFTTRVAPQHRQPERHLSGFTCGAVPNLDQAT
ncbi:hypothetical protein AHF37_09653 [Paragonimus kellicotti]|nr:hypothetical protein AHF37_09653 [Paragonimus kellicotti]